MTKPREKIREDLTAEIEDGKKKIRQLENREKLTSMRELLKVKKNAEQFLEMERESDIETKRLEVKAGK